MRNRKVWAARGAYPFIMFQEVNQAVGAILQQIGQGALDVRDELAQAERETNRLLSQPPR